MSFLSMFKRPTYILPFEKYVEYFKGFYDADLDQEGEYKRLHFWYNQLAQGKNPFSAWIFFGSFLWFIYHRMVSFFVFLLIADTALDLLLGIDHQQAGLISLVVCMILGGFLGLRLHWNWLHGKLTPGTFCSKGPSGWLLFSGWFAIEMIPLLAKFFLPAY